MRTFLSSITLPVLVAALGCGCDPSDDPGSSGNQGGQGGQGGSSTGSSSLALDKTYGDEGIARVNRASSNDWIYAAAWMADGSILCGGSTGHRGEFQREMLLARFTSAGQLDTSYGNSGFVVSPLSDSAAITSIEPLPEGGALVAGITHRTSSSAGYGFVARVDAKGTFDASFGTGGMTRVELDPVDRYAKISRSTTGQIALLAEAPNNEGLRLYRLGADGKVDTSFGDAGHVALGDASARDVVFQPDGSILALAVASSDSALYRVGTNGSIDSTFGTNGKAIVPFEPYDLERHESGKLLVAGGDTPGRLLQLDSTGAPDPSFGTNGVVDPTADDSITAAMWLPNGDILALSSIVLDHPDTIFRSLLRLAPDGTMVAFNDMPVTQTFKSYQGSVAAILQKDSKIYLAGAHQPSGASSPDEHAIVTLGLNDDGSADTTFGNAGLAEAGSLAAPELLWDMAPHADGSLVAMGFASRPVLARISGEKQDAGFGTGGFAATNLLINGMVVDAKDRVLITMPGNQVVRYTPAGVLDTTFGMQGVSQLGPLTNHLTYGITLDAKQRIVVSGDAPGVDPGQATGGATLARVLDDGSLDPSFGTGGIVIGAGGLTGYVVATALVVDPDGKIVFTGISLNPDETVFARVLEDGTTDTSFGAGGKTSIPTRTRTFRLVPRKAGGYLAAGSDASCLDDPTCATFVVALRADGTLDEGFGEGGVTRIEDASYYQAWQGLVELPDGSVVVTGAVQEDLTDKLAVWKLRSDGALDGGAFILPGKGRAMSAIVDGNGLLVGGWAFDPTSGTDMVTLRFSF